MKMRREYKPSGSGRGVSREPSWQFYKQLEFLAPFLKHRPTLRNLSQTADNIDPEETASETCESNRNADLETYAVCDDSQVMTAAVLPPVPIEVNQLVMDDGECTSNSIESTTANNSFEVGPIHKKRDKRVQEKGNNMKAILTALESSNEFIMSAGNKQEPDADELFCQSVGKELKELTDYHKSLAKLRIQQVLQEIRWERAPHN